MRSGWQDCRLNPHNILGWPRVWGSLVVQRSQHFLEEQNGWPAATLALDPPRKGCADEHTLGPPEGAAGTPPRTRLFVRPNLPAKKGIGEGGKTDTSQATPTNERDNSSSGTLDPIMVASLRIAAVPLAR